jgi:cell division protein FtsB
LAFWNHAQIEELHNENQRLQDQVSKYHREMIRYKDSGNTNHNIENTNLKMRCNQLQTEVEGLNQQLAQLVSIT